MAGLRRSLVVHLFFVFLVSEAKAKQMVTPEQLQIQASIEQDHDFAYINNKPVIPDLPSSQKQLILDRYGTFFGNQPSQPPLDLIPWIPPPLFARAPPMIRVCPAIRVHKILWTGINCDDEPVGVVQFDDVNQWVIWEECSRPESPHISLDEHGITVECSQTVRVVPMVVFRLPFTSFDDVTIQNIKIKSCTSYLGIESDSPSDPQDPVSPQDQIGPYKEPQPSEPIP
ncbi:uncharacterized protein LOC121426464 [Lytechinus variegatus]|uniref:uncharacterized protein LOC121426464 n=1 Tax=Lytechinus variegatus TaxID=7654 RepID=UPI001BB2AD49|nr:uncharacterized protein LOC121426464 [Lytechinus variegatus]